MPSTARHWKPAGKGVRGVRFSSIQAPVIKMNARKGAECQQTVSGMGPPKLDIHTSLIGKSSNNFPPFLERISTHHGLQGPPWPSFCLPLKSVPTCLSHMCSLLSVTKFNSTSTDFAHCTLWTWNDSPHLLLSSEPLSPSFSLLPCSWLAKLTYSSDFNLSLTSSEKLSLITPHSSPPVNVN